MSWIKRNLIFVIGGAVAIVLLGLAGYYCFSRWSLDKESLVKLEEAYADLERISALNPNPGNDKVNNIDLAKKQRQQVLTKMEQVQKFFVPIPTIPNPKDGVVTKEDFASSLRRTVDQLQKEAALGGVTLPQRYDFSFQAQRNLPNFAAGSLPPLSAQLGDIKIICGILFQAKINSLESVRRERVSTDDQSGPQQDYLDPTHLSITNELAVLVPYELVFQCFSAELAGALAGFGASQHGIIVKSVNVEPSGGGMMDPSLVPGAVPGYPALPYYGEGRPGFPPPVQPAAAPQPARGGLQTVLDEKPVKVTLVLNVVRLLPKK